MSKAQFSVGDGGGGGRRAEESFVLRRKRGSGSLGSSHNGDGVNLDGFRRAIATDFFGGILIAAGARRAGP